MSAIIPGYEYDIFISYRQKDNKYDGWVTEFVENLRKELEATFKDEISIYLDENPHDGILETYNVDKSLENKLRCLIFIPIISQTYCDPRSFAWQYEFIAFNKMAQQDVFATDIRLENGNTASRILPVKIHDIDSADKALLENELGGVFRYIEFIFHSTGVNRPLRAIEDHPKENLNKTYYRDQINKVANAVKEVINALKKFDNTKQYLIAENDISKRGITIKSKNVKLKVGIAAIIIAGLLILGYLLLPVFSNHSVEIVDKSIAVLPFVNMSNDPEQEYFGDGIMQEILNHLFKIGGLKIPSSTSSMRYKNSKLSVKEIAGELNVSYVLEGNVSKSGDNVRIIVRMVSGKDERLIWTEDYKTSMTAPNLLEIQSEVAQQVAKNLKVVINPDVIERIEKKSTVNTEAYTLFLKAMHEPFEEARSSLERAILLDPQFADAYAALAYLWINRGGHGGELERDIVLKEATPLIDKAQQIDNNSLLMHTTKATLSMYYKWDFHTVQKELETCELLAPSSSDLNYVFSDYLLATGNFKEALKISDNAFKLNKSMFNFVQVSLAYYHNNEPEQAYETISTAWHLSPGDGFIFTNTIRIFNYLEKYNETIEFFERNTTETSPENLIPYHLGHLGVAYNKAGNKEKSYSYLNELISRSKISPVGSPSFFAAAIYTSLGQNEKALESLDKAFSDHEVEMYWLKVEPLFKPLHGDSRFENILRKIGFN